MQEPKVKQTGNIYVYERPYEVEFIDWSKEHENTLAAVEFEAEDSFKCSIYAFCDKSKGIELHTKYGLQDGISIAASAPIDVDDILGGIYAII